jgi:hypothetical protein
MHLALDGPRRNSSTRPNLTMPTKNNLKKPCAKPKQRRPHSKPPTPPEVPPPTATPATPEPESGNTPIESVVERLTKEPAQPKRRYRKPVRLGEAMRKMGVDEYRVAAGYADALDKLQSGSSNETVEKLLVDTLKECARILDSPRPADRTPPIDVTTVVQLIHKVERPSRQIPAADQPAALPSEDPPLPNATSLPDADPPI